jgi:hypothetical protein
MTNGHEVLATGAFIFHDINMSNRFRSSLATSLPLMPNYNRCDGWTLARVQETTDRFHLTFFVKLGQSLPSTDSGTCLKCWRRIDI